MKARVSSKVLSNVASSVVLVVFGVAVFFLWT